MPIPKTTVPPDLRAAIAWRGRTESASTIAEDLGMPLGTVKTIISRAATRQDNPRLRAFFVLPPVLESGCTALALPTMPPKPDKPATPYEDVNAMLWLQSVVATGDESLIEKALEAAKRITTPTNELAKKYGEWLCLTTGNTMVAAFSSIGFGELQSKAKAAIDKRKRQQEALSRFGTVDHLYEDTPQERFCMDTLALCPKNEKGWHGLDKKAAYALFEQQQDLAPHTLADCIYEYSFWQDLYSARSAFESIDNAHTYAREEYLFWCMGRIKPRNREECRAVLRQMHDRDMMDWTGANDVLDNIIG